MVTNNSNTFITNNSMESQLLNTPFLEDEAEDTVVGAVDYKHRPAVRSKTGRWTSAAFIIGVEVGERIAYYGIQGNLINFLTGELGQPTATAAAGVNAWAGVATLVPILGAVLADSYLGKYCTIVVASIVYILGLGLLTLSATLPSLECPTNGISTINTTHRCSSRLQTQIFFGALYLVALGQGGHKPCVQAFGADQFDGDDPSESKAKSSFFNWWYFGLSVGALLSIGGLSYVQDNVSWSLGFGIPCSFMVIALVLFVLGTFRYRFIRKIDGQSPFLRIGRVFARAVRNRNEDGILVVDEEEEETRLMKYRCGSEQFRFLDKALLPQSSLPKATEPIITNNDIEEAKALLRLFPIWASCVIYGIIFAQMSTFFTKQGVTLDRSITPNFTIPAASLQSFIGICIIIVIPIYDCLLVPITRHFTGQKSGISILQRIGIGLFISIISMIVSALVEKRRLYIAIQSGLIDLPHSTVPMSIWWLLPQYVLFGISDAFTLVGMQEFFYSQVPVELRSVGMSMYLSVMGVGSFLSSFLVFVVDRLTSGGVEGGSWLSDNLNRGRLDCFYWLLAGLSSVGLVLFMVCARSYVYANNKV